MSNRCQKIFQLTLWLSIVVPAPAHQGSFSGPEAAQLQIRLYDYAELSSSMMRWATGTAAKVLLKAGIPTRWLNCSMSIPDEELDPACRVLPSPAVLVLKILPRHMAVRFRAPEGSFGFAMLSTKPNGFGNQAVVFYHRVTELAADQHTYRSVALAHILSHEVGHLLLGSGSHSRQGIMQATWRNRDLERALRGKLRFTPKQAQRMRAQFLERIRAEREEGDK